MSTFRPRLAEQYGGSLACASSVFTMLEEGLQTSAYEPAVVAMHQPASHLSTLTASDRIRNESYLIWTHQDLFEASVRLSFWLQKQGIGPASTLVSLIPNGIEWAILMYTSAVLGYTFAPLDPGALESARSQELESLMRTLRPDAVVVLDTTRSSTIDQALHKSGVSTTVRVTLNQFQDAPTLSQWTSFLQIADADGIADRDRADLLDKARTQGPDHIAAIYFTSGTSSGKPKRCPRHVSSLASVYEVQKHQMNLTSQSRFLLASANFRVISSLTNMIWGVGAAIVMPSAAFSPVTTLNAIEQQGITHILLVPALLHALVGDPTFSSRNLRSVKQVSLGGDMITKDVFTKAVTAFPRASVRASHGMSEGGGLFAWPFEGVHVEDIPFFDGIAPSGTIAKGSRVRLYNDTRQIVQRGQTGELHICSSCTIKGYVGDISSDDFYWDEHGQWFKTGDLALMTDDGLVYILGRLKDRLKRAGIPIMPAAFETCIDQFTGSPVRICSTKDH